MKENEVELTIVTQIHEANPHTVLAPRYEIAVADFENGKKVTMSATLQGSIVFEFGDGSYFLMKAQELFSSVIDFNELSKP